MNRKEKRAFNNLTDEEKADLLHSSVVSQISKPLSSAISNSMIEGIYFERERIYQKYVLSIDEAWDDRDRDCMIEKLLSFFREEHVNHVKRKNQQYSDSQDIVKKDEQK